MFPLLGERTAVYMPLFWLDRYPQYLTWGRESIAALAPMVDDVIVVSDQTLGLPPDGTTQWVVSDSPVKMWFYFKKAVEKAAEVGVGAFLYAGSDDIFIPGGVARALDRCMTEADVVIFDYARTESRAGGVVAPEFKFSFTSKDRPPFSNQEYPEAACYRTSIFTEFPPRNERMFIASSMRAAMEAGKMPVGVKEGSGTFHYYSHNQGQNDRRFQFE